MPTITESEALQAVSLDLMKTNLRIPLTEVDHDVLLTRIIHDSANFAARSTGVALADLHLLRPAIIAAVRSQYDGHREITPDAAHNAWLAPFRSYKAVE